MKHYNFFPGIFYFFVVIFGQGLVKIIFYDFLSQKLMSISIYVFETAGSFESTLDELLVSETYLSGVE